MSDLIPMPAERFHERPPLYFRIITYFVMVAVAIAVTFWSIFEIQPVFRQLALFHLVSFPPVGWLLSGFWFLVMFPLGLVAWVQPSAPSLQIIMFVTSQLCFYGFLIAFARVRTWKAYRVVCLAFSLYLVLNLIGTLQSLMSQTSSP